MILEEDTGIYRESDLILYGKIELGSKENEVVITDGIPRNGGWVVKGSRNGGPWSFTTALKRNRALKN